jgi:predicted dehydrogenase
MSGGLGMEKLNVAVVGCGIVANDHLKAWNRIDVANVAAVCDLDEKLAKNAAELYNVPKYYTSLAKQWMQDVM